MPINLEERVDIEDWDAFRRLDRLADHWWWRPGWHADRRYLTWYIVFDDAGLRAQAARMQAELADFDYLDPVPPDALHMTVQGVAFVDEMPAWRVEALGAQADRWCADMAPFTLTIGPVNGYEGGAYLRATPWNPVADLRRRLWEAIAATLGDDQVADEPELFKPHINLAYCHAAVPAADLIDRVARLRELPHTTVTVTGVDLVELRRDHHAYRWDVRHHVDFTGTS